MPNKQNQVDKHLHYTLLQLTITKMHMAHVLFDQDYNINHCRSNIPCCTVCTLKDKSSQDSSTHVTGREFLFHILLKFIYKPFIQHNVGVDVRKAGNMTTG